MNVFPQPLSTFRVRLESSKNRCRPVTLCANLQVTLWKESVDGQWVCISDVNKGQGSVSTSITEGQQNEQ